MNRIGRVFCFCLMLLSIPVTLSAQMIVPADEITFSFTEIETNSSQAYSVKARYYSTTIDYCYLRITDNSKVNYPVLMMRLTSLHQKHWITTFIETYFTGPRDTDSVFLSDYEDPIITHLLDGSDNFIGVEVEWIFKLCKDMDSPYAKDDGCWKAEGLEVFFGAFGVGSGEDGYNDSTIPVTYLDTNGEPIPEGWENNRALYMWSQSNSILENQDARTDFFSFIAAPHGQESAKIKTLLMNFDSKDIVNADFEAVRTFIADVHSRGLEIHYLSGDPSWALEEYRNNAIVPLNKVFEYNQLVSENERFDGLQFNIEPHVLSGWATGEIFGEYIDSVALYQTYVTNHNSTNSDNLIFGVTINYWYEEKYYDDRPLNEHIQDAVDFITVMNYWTSVGAIGMSATEIAYAETLGQQKTVHIALETMNLGEDDPNNYISFWNHGNTALETMVSNMESIYARYESFSGTTIHFYEEDAPSNQSYRKLRPDEGSDPNQDYNEAPVCLILSPNSGEFSYYHDITLSFEVYDNDTDTIEATIFACKQGTEVLLDTQTLNITSPDRKVLSDFSFAGSDFGLQVDVPYTLKVVVKEAEGIEEDRIESFDSTNYDIFIRPAASAPPIANAGGPYYSQEGISITLNATHSYDPQGFSLTYQWDFDGDSIYDATGQSPTITRYDDDEFVITLRVTNSADDFSEDTAIVTFHNIKPILFKPSDLEVEIHELLTIPEIQYFDPGSDDTHIVLFNWGDGNSEQFMVNGGSFSVNHTYIGTGYFNVVIAITDDDGASDMTSFFINVVQTSPPEYIGMVDEIIAFVETMSISRWYVISNINYYLEQARTYLEQNNISKAIYYLDRAKTYAYRRRRYIDSQDRITLTNMIDDLIVYLNNL